MSIRRYTFINLAGAIIPMFILLITVPLYLKVLGDVRYGVLALVWLVLGYFGFLEMGLGKATANHIARLGEASERERGTIFWSALSVNAALGMVAALILWILGSYLLTNIVKIPPEFQQEALAALPWMIATLPLALVSSVLNGALEGRSKFFVINSFQITSTLTFQLVPLFIAYAYSPSLAVVIPAAVLSRTLMNIPFFIACFRYLPLGLRPSFSKSAVKSLMSYGGWIAVSGIISPLLETVDRFLIGIVLGAQAVTFYTVPYQLVTKTRVLPGSLGRALFPKFSSANPEDSEGLAQRSLLALLLVMTPIVVGGILLLYPFMCVWIGKDIGRVASPLGEIILVGVWANGLAHIPYFLLQGKGRPDIAAKFHALEIVPFILLLWAALNFWGVYGAAWAWSIRVALDACLLFRFSGMSRGRLHIMITPLMMVMSALVGAHYVAVESGLWRLMLALVFIVWIGIWVKNTHRKGLLDIVSDSRSPQSLGAA